MPTSTNKHFHPLSDSHMHLSSEKIASHLKTKLPPEALGGYDPRPSSSDEMLEAMDEAGIHKGFAISSAYTWGMDLLSLGTDEYDRVRFENDFSAKEADKHTDRLIPFMSINPLKKYALKEIDRCISQLDTKGLKLQFTNSNVNLREDEDLRKVKDVLAYSAEQRLPVMIHFRSRNPEFGIQDAKIFIEQILLYTPGLKVQMAHLGDWGAYTDVTRDVFETFIQAFEQNKALKDVILYFDISGVILQKPMGPTQPASADELAHLTDQLRRWSLERTLWGSDWPAFNPTEYVQLTLENLSVSEEEFTRIFNNDGKELFE